MTPSSLGVLCSCGEPWTDRHYDLTGFCAPSNGRAQHDQCSGVLQVSVETHWWCACGCHGGWVPIPWRGWANYLAEVGDEARVGFSPLRTWHRARLDYREEAKP